MPSSRAVVGHVEPGFEEVKKVFAKQFAEGRNTQAQVRT